MIKVIIFDCFGVLVDSSFEPFIKKYLSHDANAVAELRIIDHKASAGEITHDFLLENFAKIAGISLEQAKVEIDNNPRNEQLLGYIKNILKPHYKIGFLSNASDNWLEKLFISEDIELFDDIVLSYEYKMAKPDPEIFKISAKRLEVTTEECLFVDDRIEYCESAVNTGMKAIVYSDFEKFKFDLADALK